MPRTHSLHQGQVPNVQCLDSRQSRRRLPSAAAITTRGSSKNPSFTVILNACRVANELCWFKKKKGKHKSKDMDKAQESPGPHWVRPGGGRVDGRWCRQGKSIQQMVYITDDWQFRVSSQFLLLLQPKEGTKRKRKGGTLMGMQGQKQQAG